MTATIRRDSNGDYVITSKHPNFKAEWGVYTCTDATLYDVMARMSEWAYNEIRAELLFNVD